MFEQVLPSMVVQTDCPNADIVDFMLDGDRIPMVAASEGFKILGTMFTLVGRTSVEVAARLRAAWGKFHQLWPLLGKRDGNLHKRLKLFDASVTQTLLWCNESWVLTQREKQALTSTQNQMLRRIAGPRRRPDELWVDWVKRSTRSARAQAKVARVRFWVDAHLRSKYCWAGHVTRMAPARLAKRGTEWRDSVWWQQEVQTVPNHLRLHRHGRTHWFRWEDDCKRFASDCGWPSWQEVAKRRGPDGKPSEWLRHCDAFIEFSR